MSPRQLVDTTLQITLTNRNWVDAGYRFDAFDYEGENFAQTEYREVVMNHRKKVIDLIFDIGNSINNYCRAVFIMHV